MTNLGSKVNDLIIAKEILSCKGVSAVTFPRLNEEDVIKYENLSHTIFGEGYNLFTTYSSQPSECSVTIKPKDSNGAYR
ncbi:MAG: hypothetical protein WC511_01240 [Candidatus Pacearchaeota archaeon]|jgi:hypothetical protein